MANNFVDSVNLANVIGTQFDNMTVRPLRPLYIYDALAKEKEWNLNTNPNKGDTIQFPVLTVFSSDTGALSPTSGATLVGGETPTYTRKSVSLELYGKHAVIDVLECTPETFVDDVADMAFSMQDQAMNSLNKLARTAFDLNKYSNQTSGTLSGTFHAYGSYGASSSTVGPLKAINVRAQVANLRGDNVQTFPDGYYYGIISPTQYTQLRADSDNAAWSKSNENVESGMQLIRRGDAGVFEGVRFFVDNEVAGNGTETISAYFLGKEGVGKAIGHDVRVKNKSSLEGTHENLLVMYWDALVGYGRVRREPIRIVECSSTQL